jgi:hypothetical protein
VSFQRYDFSSPYFLAWIVQKPGTRDEKRYPLWTHGEQDDPTGLKPVELTGLTATGEERSLSLSSLAYLSSLTLKLDTSRVPEIEIQLTPPLDEARKIIDSTIMEYAVSAIEVEFGYSTGQDGRVRSPRFQGILQPPEVSFGTDVSITLKAQGTAGYYLAATGDTTTRPKKKRIEHITDLVDALAEQGKMAKFDINICKLTDGTKQALDEEVDLVNSGKSYLHLIFEIATTVGCWVMLANTNTGLSSVVLVSQDFTSRSESIGILSLFDFPEGDGLLGPTIAAKGVFPILSVSVDNQGGIFLGPWSKLLRSPRIDPATLEAQPEVESKPGSQTQVSGADGKNQVGVKDVSNEKSGVTFDPGAGTPVSDAQKALDLTIDRLSNTNSIGIKLEIETLGIPDAVPAQFYEVRNVSARIDGYYTLFAVSHNLSASGFTSSLTLIQNSRLMVAATEALLGAPRPTNALDAAPAGSNLDTPASQQVQVNARASPLVPLPPPL